MSDFLFSSSLSFSLRTFIFILSLPFLHRASLRLVFLTIVVQLCRHFKFQLAGRAWDVWLLEVETQI